MNGKRKLYDNKGNLIFEGNYINGVKSGKGKEYIILDYKDLPYIEHDFINYIYEGEYLNGEENGKGKEYIIIGNLRKIKEYPIKEIWKRKRISKK